MARINEIGITGLRSMTGRKPGDYVQSGGGSEAGFIGLGVGLGIGLVSMGIDRYRNIREENNVDVPDLKVINR